jgi:Ran GTPase-activating protein (RanGAP) involved in mRNA processing and transport
MLIFYFELKLFFKKLFGFWIFYFLMLSNNNIGEKGAEEVSKCISSLANCPLTNFSLNLS